MTATEKLKTLKREIEDLYYWFEGYNDKMHNIINTVETLEKEISEVEINDVGKQELLRLLEQWASVMVTLVHETIVKKVTNKVIEGEAK